MATTHSDKTKSASTMAELMAKQTSQFKPLEKGEMVTGTVKKLTPGEILLDIGAKGDALVLEFDRKNVDNLMKYLHVGDTVRASVISPESEQGFPVVSLRRTLDDLLYAGLEEFLEKDEAFTVMVSESTRGGYFVTSENGISGFLPNSQTSTDDDLTGKKIEVKIIEFDRSKKRVIFSQKAVSYMTSPDEIQKYLKVGDTIQAEVTGITPYGLYIEIAPKKEVLIEGFIHISEISHDRVENLEGTFTKGQKLSAQVLEFDRENRRVNASLKSLQADSFEKAKENYKAGASVTGTVSAVKTRGITLKLADGTGAFIPGEKIPTDTTYTVGQTVSGEVTDIDSKRRVVVISPILKKTFVGYR